MVTTCYKVHLGTVISALNKGIEETLIAIKTAISIH